MYCAHCGSNNPDNLESCDRCGELLIRPDPEHPHQLGTKSCPDCKAVNESRARYCIECGHDIDGVSAISTAPRVAARPVRPPPANPVSAAGQQTVRRPPRRDSARPDPVRSSSDQVQRAGPVPGRPSVVTGAAGADDLRDGAESMVNAPNDSGTPEAQLPEDLRGWNWGAFLLPFVWGPFNKVWVGLGALMFGAVLPIPGIFGLLGYTALALLMGARGNEWAWRARKWESADHFRKVQRIWITWGTAGFLVLGVLTAMALASNNGL